MKDDIEINGKSYISVKGTVKAYNDIHPQAIKNHLKNHPNIFKNHIILDKIERSINNYKHFYIPDTHVQINIPVLKKVHDKLPKQAMYLDEFLKWRKKYYKE